MQRYITIIILLLSLAGCDIVQTGTRPGYIYSYVYFDTPQSRVTYDMETLTILLYTKPAISMGTYATGLDYAFGQAPRKDRYYDLCQKFGDINPDGYPCSDFDTILTPEASFEIVRRVTIVSDNDWNAEHPADTPLNDMFTIRYYSYFPYVSSHYTHTGSPLKLFSKPLPDLQPDEMKLIINNIELKCSSLPTESEHHTLTISFELDTDRTATYEVELDFRQADVS